MNAIRVLIVAFCFIAAPAAFANPLQKHATPADALVHEAEMMWHRGEKQALEKVRQALEIDPLVGTYTSSWRACRNSVNGPGLWRWWKR